MSRSIWISSQASAFVSLILLPVVASCSATPSSGILVETGTVTAEIVAAPAGIQCVQIAIGSATKNFTVASGASTILSFGAATPGTVAVSATAYNVACAATLPAPAWVSIPQTATIAAYGVTKLSFEMEPPPSVTGTVDFAGQVAQVAAGAGVTYAVMQDGTLKAWGNALPMGPFQTPTTVAGLSGVKSVTTLQGAACAIASAGLECWGMGNVLGIPSENSWGTNYAPAVVASASTKPFTAVSGGTQTGCAIAATTALNSELQCWGSNGNYQVSGTATPSLAPAPIVVSPAPVFDVWYPPVAVTSGSVSTCVINTHGIGVCWGYNEGAFGNGTTNITSGAATAFGGAPLTQLVMSGDAACVLEADGSVWCSGTAGSNELGTAGSTTTGVPVQVALSNVTQLASHPYARSMYAVRTDGTVWGWGDNSSGQLGNGTKISTTVPVQVTGLSGVKSVAAGDGHACALKGDSTVWCWGMNSYGQLGDGTATFHYTPVRVQL